MNKNLLKPLLLLPFLALASMLAAAALFAQGGPGGVEFAHTDYTFGKTPRDSVLTHVFTFTNKGDSRLIILETSTSCPCVTVRTPSKKVDPGETGKIEVTFKPANYRPGRFQQLVRVQTNASDRPFLLHIFGETEK